MRTLSYSITATLIFSLISLFSFGQKTAGLKQEKIKVWGNCGMCKTTIEKAAKNAGASVAKWDEETHVLAVSFRSSKTSAAKIQEKIAAAGYDTQDYTASDAAYNKLHSCCKYERKGATENPVASSGKCCTATSCAKEKAACQPANCCVGTDCCKQ